MTSTAEKGFWTIEEWLDSEMEPRHEYEHGRLVPMASPTRTHQCIVGRTYSLLDRWATEKCLGSVELELDVSLPTGVGFIPDIVFVRAEREAELFTPSGKISGVPDLVVEVISPNTRTRYMGHKLRAYHSAGVPCYWLIDSETLTVYEYQYTPEGYLLRTVAEAGETFQSHALEGFSLNLKELLGER